MNMVVSGKTFKNLLLIFCALAIFGFALLNIIARNNARTMMIFTEGGARTVKPEDLPLIKKIMVLFAGVNVPRPTGAASPSDLDRGTKNIAIQSSDGARLGAWYLDCGRSTPLAILFHGYATEKSRLIPEARIFLELGLSVMLVDFRGSGESSEAYTTIGLDEAHDVAAALRYARANLPHRTIVLYGQSMGAAAILRAIHSHGITPDAVILEAVFDSMLNTVRNRFEAMGVPSFPSAELLVYWGGRQAGYDGFKHNPADYAASVTCPALLMHGTDDPRARLGEGRRVYAAMRGVKIFKIFPSAGHEACAARFKDEWKKDVGTFLQNHIQNR